MKRWHLTLILALLAAGGAAMAVSLPVIGLPVTAVEPEPIVTPVALVAAPVVAPVVVSEVLAVSPAEPVAPVEPPAVPMRPLPVRPVVDGVHPIHVDQGEHGGVIPELSEPVRRPPVIAELPPDPPEIPDGCPACGMG